MDAYRNRQSQIYASSIGAGPSSAKQSLDAARSSEDSGSIYQSWSSAAEQSYHAYQSETLSESSRMGAATLGVLDDGRVDISWGNPRMQKDLPPLPPPSYQDVFRSQDPRLIHGQNLPESARLTFGIDLPPLNIVMNIVGSRGDVQPFIPIALRLKESGHRVRVATHERFRSFVREQGLEFYPLGGDPEELMAFMVKNRTVMPGVSSLISGDVGKKRKSIAEILQSTYASCVEPDDETGEPFYANAIIANPPSFGFLHCAEALAIPCHVMFTMPWTATKAFPHPLTNVSSSGQPSAAVNYTSYGAVEMLTWAGISDLVNDFRRNIGLNRLSTLSMSLIMSDHNVPHTYLWSPALIPKPKDWGDHIDVVGFSFMDSKTGYAPPQDLVDWLAVGTKPFYIGFGSIAGFDMIPLIEKIMLAVREVGIRVIVSKGWGGASVQSSQDVYMIGDCPHDWLFTQVAGVVHHGGAGTSAAGLRLGKPTIVCPFFADQPFWGAMCATAGAGPTPIPARELTTELMVEAIRFCQLGSTVEAAAALAQKIGEENGADAAVRSFVSHLPLEALKSDVDPSRVASVVHVTSGIKMSIEAARVILTAGHVQRCDLADYKTFVWNTQDRLGDVWLGSAPFKGVYKGIQSAYQRPIEGYKNGELITGVIGGVAALLWYPAKGFFLTIGQLGSAMRNIPSLYDPNEQAHKPDVHGFASGMKETGKSFGKNLFHASTDFLVKPITMGLQYGPKGIPAGFGVGVANMIFKPTAMALDLLILPTKGAYRSIRPSKAPTFRHPGQLSRIDPRAAQAMAMSRKARREMGWGLESHLAGVLEMNADSVRAILEAWRASSALRVKRFLRYKKKKTEEDYTKLRKVRSL